MRRVRLGMVGGGQGAFIGGVHRIAARIDDRYTLIAGALSSNADRAAASAVELGIPADRSYSDFETMAKAEAERDDGIEAVAIVTPNHMHAAPAVAFLRAGIHVICDKPLAATPQQAAQIEAAAATSQARFFLTHNYTGYPLMRHARQMIAQGDLGKIRVVQVEYAQDWLTEATAPDNKQADWRTDPVRAGGGAIGDIGTHALNLACFVTGLVPQALSADLHSFVPGRQVDDNAHVQLRFEGGARGMLWASQVAVGHENGLRLRIYGEKAGIDWSQEQPNALRFTAFGQPPQILTRGAVGAQWARIPPGHPEGYLEAFATLYSDIADTIVTGHGADLVPGLVDGMDGMWFINACQQSAGADAAWVFR